MRPTYRLAVPFKFAFGALACLIALAIGCSAGPLAKKQAHFNDQETAFKLMDEAASYEKQGDHALALERYTRVATVYQLPAAYFNIGRVYETMGKKPEAATAYQKALELSPDYQEARIALMALGYGNAAPPAAQQPEPAKPVAAPSPAPTPAPIASPVPSAPSDTAPPVQSPALAGTSAEDTQTTATESKSNKDIEKAAGRQVPTLAEVRAAIFSPEEAKGKLPSAEEPTFDSDHDVILGTYAYHYRKGQQLAERQQYDKAAEEFSRALEIDPSQLDARLDLGDMMLKSERYPRARLQYEKAMAEFPQSPRPLQKMGNYYLALKRVEDAREMFHKALEVDPNCVEALNNLAVINMQEKKFADAATLLDRVIEADPKYANAYLNRGIIASDVDKDAQKGLECFRKYVELNGPRSKEVRVWITELEAKH